ncbi:LTXXQ motif family protein [Sulfidibacter corallicola]|uniref:Periplasmic heavy metal sensor n=1 Tax=Sulfidibacter corallicola TaxID=2818388 RepID=A0A8A4TNC8_SULCO|nr:hypothetical protein [Sulfidibacter corallicola]QTD50401.1 hypothetical protein J3U87_32860 [Sulfidibacter corallicola]
MKAPYFKTLVALLVLCSSLTVLARGPFPGPGFKHAEQINEDLVYIHQHIMDQKAAELAGILDLSDEQVTSLRAVRADVDAIKAAHEPTIEAAREALNTAAADIRAQLEAGAELSDAQKEQLKALRDAVRQAGRDMKGEIREASQGLDDLLTDAQTAAMRDFFIANRPERDQSAEDGESRRRRGRGFGRRAKRGGDRSGQFRILLSDAFLNQYN